MTGVFKDGPMMILYDGTGKHRTKLGVDKTARWMGHGDGDLLLTTYKGLVTQSAARCF
ncbi:hypothetical protein ACFLQL_02245 [Verrucomicrobiota bacterium]